MKRIKLVSLSRAAAAIAILSSALVSTSSAATLASWNFESPNPADTTGSDIGPIAPATGSGAASGHHASAATAYTTPAGNGSTDSLSSNTWAIGDYYQFTTTNDGSPLIQFNFDQTSSNTGPRDFQVQFSTDGTTYAPVGSYAVLANAAPNPVWNATTGSSIYSNSFTVPSVLATNLFFRLVNSSTVSANGGTVAAGGTSRVDNISITGIPEPTTILLCMASLAGIGIMRRFA